MASLLNNLTSLLSSNIASSAQGDGQSQGQSLSPSPNPNLNLNPIHNQVNTNSFSLEDIPIPVPPAIAEEKQAFINACELNGINASLPPVIRPRLNTYGVELEFLIAVTYEDLPLPFPEKGVRPIVLKRTVEDPKLFVTQLVVNALLKYDIRAASESQEIFVRPEYHEGRRVLHRRPETMPTGVGPLRHAEDDAKYWTVGTDGSLEGDKAGGPLIAWLGLEITSPALWEGEVGIKQVQRVMGILHKEFWVRVNETCGLHVHVGWGHEMYNLDTLRRSAALLWALEPMMLQCQEPGRGDAFYSKKMRGLEENPLTRGYKAGELHAALIKHGSGGNAEKAVLGRQRGFRDKSMYGDYLMQERMTDVFRFALKDEDGKKALEEYTVKVVRDAMGDQANDISGMHGLPYDRPAVTSLIGWPLSQHDHIYAHGDPLSWAPTRVSEGKLPMDQYAGSLQKCRPQGFHCDDTDVSVYDNVMTGWGQMQMDTVKLVNVYHEKRAQGIKFFTAKIQDPLVAAPDIEGVIPVYRVVQPVDWHYQRVTRKANHLIRPYPSYLGLREKYYTLNPSAESAARRKANKRLEVPDHVPRDFTSVWSGVSEILAADLNAYQISALLQGNVKYNATNVTRVSRNGPPKGETLEIRMGSPSWNPGWVATWVSVCVAVIGWAGRANYREFMHMVRLVALAQQDPTDPLIEGGRVEYDFAAFLEDIGEPGLAREVIKRLEGLERRGTYKEIPEFESVGGKIHRLEYLREVSEQVAKGNTEVLGRLITDF